MASILYNTCVSYYTGWADKVQDTGDRHPDLKQKRKISDHGLQVLEG